jgi:hypothetical protein
MRPIVAYSGRSTGQPAEPPRFAAAVEREARGPSDQTGKPLSFVVLEAWPSG